MTTRKATHTALFLAAIMLMLAVLPATAEEIPDQLPDPDSTPPAADKPVQVYILSGQSNMVGMGDLRGGSSTGNRRVKRAHIGMELGPIWLRGGDPRAPKNVF